MKRAGKLGGYIVRLWTRTWYRICRYTNAVATIARYGRKRLDEAS